MKERLTLGSLFDGISGFPLAGLFAGMKPIWASEIEPFPIRVATKRLPYIKQLGDIKVLDGGEIEPVDVITFGSPCQNLSCASAKRTGLQGEKSSLFFEAVRVIAEMRKKTNGQYPKWGVWENVPGALSSANGHDFRQVLESLTRIKDPDAVIPLPDNGRWLSAGEIMGDTYSLAWRILGAQHFGVPQRRNRIFLVVDFDGHRAGKVLFESESVSRDHQPSEPTREGAPANASGSAGGSDQVFNESGIGYWMPGFGCLRADGELHPGSPSHCIVYPTVTPPLCARADSSPCIDRGQPFLAMFMGGQGEKARGIGYSETVAPTLKSVPSGGNTVPDVVYALQGNGIDRAETAGCNGRGWNDETMYTLNTIDKPAVVFAQNQRDEVRDLGDVGGALNASPGMKQQTYVAYAADCRNGALSEEISGTLQAKPNGGQSLNCVNPVVYDARGNGDGAITPTITGDHQRTISDYTALCVGDSRMKQTGKHPRKYIVRRLLPIECCRLQGYPDGWTENLGTEAPTEEEIAFWTDVFLTWQKAQGKPPKPRSRNAIIRWLNDPRTDAAEYKAYGNSVAVPCVHFVLAGIVWASGKETKP